MPSARANTFADPPGTTPTAGHVGAADRRSPSTPLTTSFTVPSPPCTISTSTPSRAASRAISIAWPRWSVCATVSLTRLSSAWASRSRPAGVVDVALGFTISTARTRQEPIGAVRAIVRGIGRVTVGSAYGSRCRGDSSKPKSRIGVSHNTFRRSPGSGTNRSMRARMSP